MDLGPVEEANPKDQQMVEFDAVSLKRGRSPLVSPTSSPRGASPSLVISSLAGHSTKILASTKVCPLVPCMAGDLGGRGSLSLNGWGPGGKGRSLSVSTLLGKEVDGSTLVGSAAPGDCLVDCCWG